MIWSYLRTGWPFSIGATAILCPRITRARAVTPAAAAPSGIGSTATTTLSFGERRTVRGVLIVFSQYGSSFRSEPGEMRVAAVPGRADHDLVHADARRLLRNIHDQVGHVLGLNHARSVLGRDRRWAQIEDRSRHLVRAQHGRADAVLELFHVDCVAHRHDGMLRRHVGGARDNPGEPPGP